MQRASIPAHEGLQLAASDDDAVDVARARGPEADFDGLLSEKDQQLREMHHRVKNNLQLVSSLINLQLTAEVQASARSALKACQGRIHAVAAVHDALQAGHDLRVPLARYVESIAASVFRAAGAKPVALDSPCAPGPLGASARWERPPRTAAAPEPREIGLLLALGNWLLPIDQAIPCGLIVNELLANALAHAFPHGRRGAVRVSLEALAGQRLRLSVRDDGVGLPAGFAVERAQSVGMQVVSALVEQLNANLEVASDGGACFAMTFALD